MLVGHETTTKETQEREVWVFQTKWGSQIVWWDEIKEVWHHPYILTEEDIKKVTENYSDDHVPGYGGHGTVLGFTFSLVLFRDSILTKNVDFCIFKFGTGKMKKPERETLTVHKQEQEIF
jgi:hypothetical protein